MWLKQQKNENGSAAKHADRSDVMSDLVVVEDSEAVSNILTVVAEKAGMTTTCAASLSQVKALDLRESTALILLDLSLDRSDAIDVLTYLESVAFAGSIVLMSGQDPTVLSYIASVGHQKGLRMLAPLQKPFKIEALRKVLVEHNERDPGPIALDFDAARKAGHVEVWYQPRVHFTSFHAYGFESMVRIRHPRFGRLATARFQDRLDADEAAEMNALLVQEAIAMWKRLAHKGLVLRPSVTLRVRDLLATSLLEVLKTCRPDDMRWPGLTIKLSDFKRLFEDMAIRETMIRLQLQNTRFALSDLAQASQVLTCLPQIRFSEILVGKPYTDDCCRNGERKQLCGHAVQLARRLKLRVVAEGMDRLEDMKTVRQLGFDVGQGHLFEAPMPFQAFETLLEKRTPLFAAARIGTAA